VGNGLANFLWAPALALISLGGDELAEAKKLLEGPTEGNFNEGARRCVAANNAEAAELLLKKLGGQWPHFRDLAFEHLEKFTNPYAMAVIEQAATTSRDEMVRAWCCDLLGAYGGKSRLEPLIQGLGDSSTEVKLSAARALARIHPKSAGNRLSPLKSHADPAVRVYATFGWVLSDPKNLGKILTAAAPDRDAGARAAILGILPEVAPDEAFAKSKAAIADADWRVRLQAAENLAKIKTKDSIGALVALTGDGRRIIAKTAERELGALTGEHFSGKRAWQMWWDAKGDTFEFKDPASKPASAPASGETGVFFGLPIDSDHVVFLIDRGASMANKAPSGKGTKMDEVLEELGRTLQSLPSGTRFNVLSYANNVSAWEKKSKETNEKAIASAIGYLKSQPLLGSKDIWGALQAVIADPDIDTVYLMSDGEPEDGLYVHYNRVVDHIRRINPLRKLVIHTVHVSDPAWSAATAEWYRSQLREIAKATGGKYVEK
jgi:HEAT repeat protein